MNKYCLWCKEVREFEQRGVVSFVDMCSVCNNQQDFIPCPCKWCSENRYYEIKEEIKDRSNAISYKRSSLFSYDPPTEITQKVLNRLDIQYKLKVGSHVLYSVSLDENIHLYNGIVESISTNTDYAGLTKNQVRLTDGSMGYVKKILDRGEQMKEKRINYKCLDCGTDWFTHDELHQECPLCDSVNSECL